MVYSTTVYAAVAAYFLLLFAMEALAMRRKHERYPLSDSMNSLFMGMGNVIVKTVFVAFQILVYDAVFQMWHAFELAASSPAVWAGAYIGADFCFYVYHRMAHTVNVLWGTHVQHHSSEEYNLTTALRQDWTGAPYGIAFYLPLALLGIPYEVFAAVIGLNLMYQFWLHTRYIGKLPAWFEAVFNTPSHHRAHHAQNTRYMDKNYAGTFIIWDRMLGTFQPELAEDPVVFGVTTPPKSWNPLTTVIHIYALLWADAKAATNWSDKLTIWFRPTGWRPRNLPAHEKAEGYVMKHTAVAPRPYLVASGIMFAAAFITFAYFLTVAGGTLPQRALPAALFIVVAAAFGWFVDRPAEPALQPEIEKSLSINESRIS